MRSVEQHLAACLAVCRSLPPETTEVQGVLGRVLAGPVTSRVTLPPFANSSMDGFAVRVEDVAHGSARLPVSADIAAGDSAGPLTPGTAARIMTGAPVPEGAEAVVQVEWTDAYGPQGVRFGAPAEHVTISPERPVTAGMNIRRAGEDVRAGDVVLQSGALLDPRAIGLLAAVGVATVEAIRRPRVVVLSTGSELRQPGEELAPGQIYDSNSFAIAAAATVAGATATRVAATADDPDKLLEVLQDAARDADLMVTTGGVSVGAYDVVKQLLQASDAVEFVKVAMKPGMPQGVGTFEGTPILTLPGNPVSAWVSWEVFGRPMVRAMRGLPAAARPSVAGVVKSDRPWQSPPGKVEFTRVRLDDGWITPVGRQQSHLLADLAHANALAVIPLDVATVSDGMTLQCYPLAEA